MRCGPSQQLVSPPDMTLMIRQGARRSQRISKPLSSSLLLVLGVHKVNPDPDPHPLGGRDPEMVPGVLRVSTVGKKMGSPLVVLLKIAPGVIKTREFFGTLISSFVPAECLPASH